MKNNFGDRRQETIPNVSISHLLEKMTFCHLIAEPGSKYALASLQTRLKRQINRIFFINIP